MDGKTTGELASDATRAVAHLAAATRHYDVEGWQGPQDIHDLAQTLAVAAYRLQAVLSETEAFLTHLESSGRIMSTSTKTPAAPVDLTRRMLRQAHQHTEALGTALSDASTASSGLRLIAEEE